MSHLTYHHVLPSQEYGGAAEVAFRIAEYARNEKARSPFLWLPGPGRAWQKASEERLTVREYELPSIVNDSRTRIAMANLRNGWKWRQHRPGILHLHSAELYGGLPLACSMSSMQRIVHIHLEQDEATIRWAFRRLPELVLTCADFLIENVRRYLSPKQQDQLRIVSAPNCIDMDRYFPGDQAAAKTNLGAPANIPLILMLANLSPHKGQATAIRAVSLLKQQGTIVNCWLAGVDRTANSNYPAQLQSLIEEIGVQDQVKLLGYRTDGPELLCAADFFLLPSTREGLPLSVLEAQASKVPVLAAPTAGIPEVVEHERTGFLIAAADAPGYADCLQRLIDQPEFRTSITDNAWRHVQEKHGARTYCERIWGIYEQLLSSESKPFRRHAALV